MFSRIKINLSLLIGPSRPDGYHELHSHVLFVETGDILKLIPTPRWSIVLGEDIPQTDNSITRAIAWLSARRSVSPHRISIDKKIPLQSGLGGGSVDAGAVLRWLLSSTERQTILESPESMLSLAKSVGADVPACLWGSSCVIQGIGEKLTPWTLPWNNEKYALVVVGEGMRCATPAMFASLTQNDQMNQADPPLLNPSFLAASQADPQTTWDHLQRCSPEQRNSFTPQVFHRFPRLKQLIKRLGDHAELVGMSGSGPALYGIVGSRKEAQQALSAVRLFARRNAEPDPWFTIGRVFSSVSDLAVWGSDAVE